jgi:ribosome biogenesis GTPase
MNIYTYNESPFLDALGWDMFFQKHFQALNITGAMPARVFSESKDGYGVYARYGELTAKISGKMRYQTGGEAQRPAVGDWVVVTSRTDEKLGLINAVLPRKSRFSRKVAGERTEEQVVAANVDTIFIVAGLDGGRNLNLRRIERYLTLTWNSGSSPVIVLNKADLCPDARAHIRSVEVIAEGVPVHSVSAKEHKGLEKIKCYLGKGKTAAFLGSSGVGKSALINALLGFRRQETGEVRANDRMGRHTTTRRELILLPDGGMVIDTPGMREIQMWAGEDDLQDAFPDVASLAEQCRFNNCTHDAEPGCAVQDAIAKGFLDPARFGSYRKLRSEIEYLASREQDGARLQEKAKWKKISQWSKEFRNLKDR